MGPMPRRVQRWADGGRACVGLVGEQHPTPLCSPYVNCVLQAALPQQGQPILRVINLSGIFFLWFWGTSKFWQSERIPFVFGGCSCRCDQQRVDSRPTIRRPPFACFLLLFLAVDLHPAPRGQLAPAWFEHVSLPSLLAFTQNWQLINPLSWLAPSGESHTSCVPSIMDIKSHAEVQQNGCQLVDATLAYTALCSPVPQPARRAPGARHRPPGTSPGGCLTEHRSKTPSRTCRLPSFCPEW